MNITIRKYKFQFFLFFCDNPRAIQTVGNRELNKFVPYCRWLCVLWLLSFPTLLLRRAHRQWQQEQAMSSHHIIYNIYISLKSYLWVEFKYYGKKDGNVPGLGRALPTSAISDDTTSSCHKSSSSSLTTSSPTATFPVVLMQHIYTNQLALKKGIWIWQ